MILARKWQTHGSTNRVWFKVIGFSLMVFFLGLADAILSDWVPEYMQEKLGGSLLMGIVFSFSSVVGFAADMVFPQILRKCSFQRLMAMAVGGALVFVGLLLWSTEWPVVAIFLMAMAVWGVYYEFMAFGGQQFVVEIAPVQMRSAVWSMLGVFKGLAYFLGPIVGGLLVFRYGNKEVLWFSAAIVFIGLFVWKLLGYKKERSSGLGEVKRFSIKDEIGHWMVLSHKVWPVLIVSFVLGLIDSTFWTTGTVFSTQLARENWWGGMFLSFYMLPPLFMGLIMSRLKIISGKKKIAEVTLFLAGIALIFIGMQSSIVWILIGVLVMATLLTITQPVTDAVYTDILSRMGRERIHMAGLSNSMMSLAYVAGPILSGWMASVWGEKMTFGAVGWLTVFVSVFLLLVTPKKIRLPQEEIQSWE